MDSDDFDVARILVHEDNWQYICMTDMGEMVFTRTINGITYTAKVSKDR